MLLDDDNAMSIETHEVSSTHTMWLYLTYLTIRNYLERTFQIPKELNEPKRGQLSRHEMFSGNGKGQLKGQRSYLLLLGHMSVHTPYVQAPIQNIYLVNTVH